MASLGLPGLDQLPTDMAELLDWIGPRLWRVFSLFQDVPLPLLPGVELAMARNAMLAVEAAAADADEFEREENYRKAAKSYTFAVNMARQAHVIDLNNLVDLMSKQSSVLLKVEDFMTAAGVAEQSVQVMPDFFKGYILLSTAVRKGLGVRAFPACHLFAAMEHCNLTDDQNVEVIVDASQLVASVVLDICSGKEMQQEMPGIEQLRNPKPKMPSSKPVWDKIFHQLFTSRSFAALALLAVGLPGGDISHLNSFAQEIDVDCSKMEVEQMYEALTPSDVEMWGDKLAVFIMDHGGGIGRHTDDPLAVLLVRLALKQKSLDLLQHVMQTVGREFLNINGLSPQGDTALHVVVKSPPFGRLHQRLIGLLIKHGAVTSTCDADGKTPAEYVDKTSAVFKQLTGIARTEEATPSAAEHLKTEGNRAFKARDHKRALECYKKAVAVVEENRPPTMRRDLAVLYSNMAAVYTDKQDDAAAIAMARKSIEKDPTYHKPYWKLGTLLRERKRYMEACEQLLSGAACKEADNELKSQFIREICSLLSSLTDTQMKSIMERMQPYLAPCWPKIAETLSKSSLWDTIRRLVLGPPELTVDRSVVPSGWKFADRYKDTGELKVGYAMCLKATTHDLSTLMEAVEMRTVPNIYDFATDLVLALLLQGARLETLAASEEDTCYHVALSLCCLTEKLGLLRYILSERDTLKQAQEARNQEERTLLHTACLHFGDGLHEVGKQIVKLLVEKGFDPSAQDMLNKKAEDYLAPRSPMTQLLTKPPASVPQSAEELTSQGNNLFRKKCYREAVELFSLAIDKLLALLPPQATVQRTTGHEKEKHELAIIFCNRAQCHLRLGQADKAFSDAKDSVAWDGHWYRGHLIVGRALLDQKKPQKAVRALSNAYNALEKDASEKLRIEVLQDLMKCLVNKGDAPDSQLSDLGHVSPDLWAKVAYDFFCEGNRLDPQVRDPFPSWKAGRQAVQFLSQLTLLQRPAPTTVLQLDLQPLCSWHVPVEFTEAFLALFLYLLGRGCDHKRLSYYEGDTYIHAAACFTVKIGESTLLQFVMGSYAKPNREKNLQDIDGNTALHLMALSNHRGLPQLGAECRLSMLEILLDLGLDPSVRNKQGKTALECVASFDDPKLRKLLETATRKASSQQQWRTYVPRRPAADSTSRPDSSSKYPKESPKSTQTLVKSPPGGKGQQSSKCSDCEGHLADVRWRLDRSRKPEVVFSKLVSIFECSHSKKEGASLVSQAVDLIVEELGKSSSPDVPDVLLRIPQTNLHQVLEKLAAQNKWTSLAAVVDKAEATDAPRGQFAKNISIKSLVSHEGLLGGEQQRVKILDQLASHGARLHGNQGRDSLRTALKNGEYRVAERLIRLGTDPRLLTLNIRDSPLHAALEIALFRDRGNFGLFELLLSLYKDDSRGRANLNPRKHYKSLHQQIEKAGNTDASQRAVTLLLPYKDAPSHADTEFSAEESLQQPPQPTAVEETSSSAPDTSSDKNRGEPSHQPTQKQSSKSQKKWCEECEKAVSDAPGCFTSTDTREEGYKLLVTVLGCPHPRNIEQNVKFVRKAIDCLVQQLSSSARLDVPDVLLDMPTTHLRQILDKLATQGKWLQLEAIVMKSYQGDHALGSFAKSVSILNLVKCKGLFRDEETRHVQTLDLLVSHGAKLPQAESKEVVSAAIQQEEFHLLARLIEIGADPYHVTLERGDTPLQAALTVALRKDKGNFRVFEALVGVFDKDPAKYTYLNPRKHSGILKRLTLQAGSTPHGQRAAELLASRNITLEEKAKEVSSTAQVQEPLSSELESASEAEFEPAGSSSEESKTDSSLSKPDTLSVTMLEERETLLDCTCEKLVKEARQCLDEENTDAAYSKLISVLRQECPRKGCHLNFIYAEEAISLILQQLCKLPSPDVPMELLGMPGRHLRKVLQKLAEGEKWQQLKEVVVEAEANDVMCGSFAAEVPIGGLVSCQALDGQEDLRLQVLEILFDHGARMPATDSLGMLNKAVGKKEFLVAEKLLEVGAKSMKAGENPPLHTALKMALDRNTGNFDWFEKLLSLYKGDPQKYSVLDPKITDESGNTVLHVAMTTGPQDLSQKAIELLMKYDAVADAKNKDGKMAVEFLTSCDDRRAEQLLNFFVANLEQLTWEVAERAKASTEKWSEVEKPDEDDKGDADLAEAEEDRLEPSPSHDGEREEVEEEGLDLQVFDNLEWDVECTPEVLKILRDKRVSQDMKQRIVKRIQLLASGEWRQILCKPIPEAKGILQLFEAKLSKGARILWELAISPWPCSGGASSFQGKEMADEPGGQVHTELIRVWDIVFQHDKIYHAVQRIVQSHKRGAEGNIQRRLRGAKSRQFQGEEVTPRKPMHYFEADASETTETGSQLYPPASAIETEFHILKFYSFSPTLVYSVLKNIVLKIDFPFRVTDREQTVIDLELDTPILLLGRSGTGKTTCCLYRLWARFLAYWTRSDQMGGAHWLPRTVHVGPNSGSSDQSEVASSEGQEQTSDSCLQGATAASSSQEDSASSLYAAKAGCFKSEEYSHLHQLFVTKNQRLCSEVLKNFRRMAHAEKVAREHVAVEDIPMPHRLQDIDEHKFPLFLTSRQLILMLDASLPPPHFFKRNPDGSLRVKLPDWGTEEEIFAYIPFDDDVVAEDVRGVEERATDKKIKDNRREVTFEVFAYEIWPKIIKNMQVDYHPILVWTEIMSFIKGSFAALTQQQGFLSMEEYDDFGRKQAPNFTGSRDKVYELFERYNNYRRQHGLYDEADLVFNIYRRMQDAGPLPWVLHQVFVDETQDFTQAELTVLIQLADNPNDMFLTGDTAQCIMRGISFRFSDLKTVFHHAKQSQKDPSKRKALKVPKDIHQLIYNYRSHTGILSLASSVVDALVDLFPDSFDKLERDQGFLDGPKPVLLEPCSPMDLAMLLMDSKQTTSQIEFGAHQAILVVNEEAKRNLPRELSQAIRLTIFEAKGLEFDDVLLYNFFKDSQASKEWRVLTDYLHRLSRNEAKDSAGNSVEIDQALIGEGSSRPLAFDPNVHKILNSELKQLYTAVTRARVNVWIFDESEDKRAPMFEYFQARRLVQMKRVSMLERTQKAQQPEGTAERQGLFAQATKDPAEWRTQGDRFMEQGLYEPAAQCYSQAGTALLHKIAVAHQRALEASHLRARLRDMRESSLRAAMLFLECHAECKHQPSQLAQRFNLAKKAGLCLRNAGLHSQAAKVFEKNAQFEEAGQEYCRARQWREGSKCFEKVDNFREALRILDDHELYEEAIACLRRYTSRREAFEKKHLPLPPALANNKPDPAISILNLTYKKAEFYHRKRRKGEMLAAVHELPIKEEQIKFLQGRKYLQEAAELLCAEGRASDAANMMLHNGEFDSALQYAQRTDDNSLMGQCYYHKAHVLFASKHGPTFKRQRDEESDDSKGTSKEAAKETPKESAAQTPGAKLAAQTPGGKPAAQTPEANLAVQTPGAKLAVQTPGGKPAAQTPGTKLAVQAPEARPAVQALEARPAVQVPGLTSKETCPPLYPSAGSEITGTAEKDKGESVHQQDKTDTSKEEIRKKVLDLLEEARRHFRQGNDRNGVGECLLLMSQLPPQRDLLMSAWENFEAPQPVPNLAGTLECTEVLVHIVEQTFMDTDCCECFVESMENVFEVLRILFNPSTPDDMNSYQVYLRFYGLEAKDRNVVLYPKLRPRCIRMIGSKQLFNDKEEKQERVEKEADKVFCLLAKHLIQGAKTWFLHAEDYLEYSVYTVHQCPKFQLAQNCEDGDSCLLLHEVYSRSATECAIAVLSQKVRLDHTAQGIYRYLQKLDDRLTKMDSLSKVAEKWLKKAEQSGKWMSVEQLLSFLFPAGLITYHMIPVVRFCLQLQRKEFQGVREQVERYLIHLWENPGRVGRGKSDNTLKERCKSSNWFVLASLVSALFGLDLNTKLVSRCSELEHQLSVKKPGWVTKKHKYALIMDRNRESVMILAHRHLDALEYLQPTKFDPFEALIKFTKFVKLLSNRGEVSLMPDLPVFLFWLEAFAVLALCLAAKLRGNGALLLPSCYPRLLQLVNLTMPNSKRGGLEMLIEKFQPLHSQNLQLLHQRIETLVEVICGSPHSNFSILDYLIHRPSPTNYLLTERVLVLALTLLLNLELDNVPESCELSVLRAVHLISEDVIVKMPRRLATLVKSVQNAAGFRSLSAAVDCVLRDGMPEQLHLYQWRTSRKEKGSWKPVDMSSWKQLGSRFLNFNPAVHLHNTEPELRKQGDSERKDEEEEELTMEEKAHYRQQMTQSHQQEIHNVASLTITRFLRTVILWKRSKTLRRHCIIQMEKDLFSPFLVTAKMCGICGVSFVTAVASRASVAGLERTQGDEDRDDDPEDEGEKKEEAELNLKQAHLSSDEHRNMQSNFERFRDMYRRTLALPMLGLRFFLFKYKVRQLKDTLYQKFVHEVSTVLSLTEELQHRVAQTMQERKWSEHTDLMRLMLVLNKIFHERVREPIEEHFERHQKTASKNTGEKMRERKAPGMSSTVVFPPPSAQMSQGGQRDAAAAQSQPHQDSRGQGLPQQREDYPPPVFLQDWQVCKQVFSDGGHLQTDDSDVILHIPEGAVSECSSGAIIKGAVSTDLTVCGELGLSENESVASPIVEYFAGKDTEFDKPVCIILPHFLPPNVCQDSVRVYQFHRDEGGCLKVQKLNPTVWYENKATAYRLIPELNQVHIFAHHFTGYVCTYCKCEQEPPCLRLRLYGKHIQRRTRDVDLKLFVWDTRLDIRDFRKAGLPNPADERDYITCETLGGLRDITGLELGVCLHLERADQWMFKEYEGGNILTPERRLELASFMSCCADTVPKQVDWTLQQRPQQTPDRWFECLVSAGYVREQEDPMRFLERPKKQILTVPGLELQNEQRAVNTQTDGQVHTSSHVRHLTTGAITDPAQSTFYMEPESSVRNRNSSRYYPSRVKRTEPVGLQDEVVNTTAYQTRQRHSEHQLQGGQHTTRGRHGAGGGSHREECLLESSQPQSRTAQLLSLQELESLANSSSQTSAKASAREGHISACLPSQHDETPQTSLPEPATSSPGHDVPHQTFYTYNHYTSYQPNFTCNIQKVRSRSVEFGSTVSGSPRHTASGENSGNADRRFPPIGEFASEAEQCRNDDERQFPAAGGSALLDYGSDNVLPSVPEIVRGEREAFTEAEGPSRSLQNRPVCSPSDEPEMQMVEDPLPSLSPLDD